MNSKLIITGLLVVAALAFIPLAIVNGQYTSTISGTVRCGGGCDTVGLVYGEPISVAGRIVAVMTMALDPNTGVARPDLPLQNAQTSFEATDNGHYELQGVEPGVFDLYVQATGYPNTLFDSGVTVLANQNLSIDAYVAPQGFTVSIASTSTAQVSSYTYSSTPVTITSTPSLQMPQPPQQTATQPTATQSTNNTPQLMLAIEVIIAVVLAAVFLYSIRKRQTVKTAAEVQLEAKKVTSQEAVQTETPTPSKKNFCMECGNELPLKSKFCNNCGTKQP